MTHTHSLPHSTTANPSRIIRFFYENPGSSRAQAARALDLTPAALTIITSKLLDSGILAHSKNASQSRNGRAVGLEVNASQYKVIGVKFARTLIELGVFDISGTQISSYTFPPASDASARESIEAVRVKVRSLLSADSTILSVGIAVPGPYIRATGRISLMSGMPTWDTVNFRTEFDDAFDVPTFLEQDARAGALAESLFDPTTDSSSLAYYLLGEGIGLGIIDTGRLVNGHEGTATEIGHISIDVNGLPCECGNYGCLEKYCSATAVHRQLIDNHPTLIPGVASMTHAQAVTALCSLAAEGNGEARELLTYIGELIGYGAVTIINGYNPHQIVLGDLLAGAGSILLDAVTSVVQQRVLPDLRDSTVISLSGLPYDPILSGAAASATEQFLENPSRFLVPRPSSRVGGAS